MPKKYLSPREYQECGYSSAPIEGAEMDHLGPSLKEWLKIKLARHRIGDAELIPLSPYHSDRGPTPEGDQSDPKDAE